MPKLLKLKKFKSQKKKLRGLSGRQKILKETIDLLRFPIEVRIRSSRYKIFKTFNLRQKLQPFSKHKVEIFKLPEIMDLDLSLQEVIESITQFKNLCLSSRTNSIKLELENLQYITPECALMLLAFIDISISKSNGKRLVGTYPKDLKTRQILNDIGYFRYFKIKDYSHKSKNPLVCFRARSGDKTDGEAVDRLIRIFEKQFDFSASERRALYSALVECMANVNHHAYNSAISQKKKWWMLGSADLISNEISFTFMDLGLGIPSTLRRRQLSDIWKYPKKDCEIVSEAVRTQSSRYYLNERRGNGLPQLLKFLSFSETGKFRILSKHAHNIFEPGGIEKQCDIKSPFEGTLISWSLGCRRLKNE